jgi:deazaflavin-dependent oxidoreductase (nitroreductase family)
LLDSPRPSVKEHINNYVSTNGRKGHTDRDANALLLTVRGRRSGKLHRTALYYARRGADYFIVGSWAGHAEHPQWYLNLLAHPEATIQVGAEIMDVVSREASGEEYDDLWATAAAFYPKYDEYKAMTANIRRIPIMVLTPRR